MLGFDVFDLNEVIPEFIADVGIKKGEKIDFAVKIDGKITILVEVKPITLPLGQAQYSQLFRYFATMKDVRLAILTNGREVWFFSDVDAANRLDNAPFFTFDLQSFDTSAVVELARFQKDGFSIDAIVEAASKLKFVDATANYIRQQMTSPSDDFARLVGRNIYEGSITKSVLEEMKAAVSAGMEQVIRDHIQDRLNIAFKKETSADAQVQTPKVDAVADPVETTEEELQAFMIVRAICASKIPVARITLRDAKSYCCVYVDDNNRKPVCRFYFNGKKTRSIGIFNREKVETKHAVESLDDIFKFAGQLEAAVLPYASAS